MIKFKEQLDISEFHIKSTAPGLEKKNKNNEVLTSSPFGFDLTNKKICVSRNILGHSFRKFKFSSELLRQKSAHENTSS